LEDQRRQLESIKNSVRNIFGKEWDVLISSCREDSDGNNNSRTTATGRDMRSILERPDG
jgi:hypothetical protein